MLVIGVGVVVAAREVLVAEQRTEASEARLAAIVDSAMDAIITVDEAQHIVLFNRAAEQVFGVRARARRSAARSSASSRQRFRGAHRGHVERFGSTGVTSRRMGDVTHAVGAARRRRGIPDRGLDLAGRARAAGTTSP